MRDDGITVQYALHYFCRQEILSKSSFGWFDCAIPKKVVAAC